MKRLNCWRGDFDRLEIPVGPTPASFFYSDKGLGQLTLRRNTGVSTALPPHGGFCKHAKNAFFDKTSVPVNARVTAACQAAAGFNRFENYPWTSLLKMGDISKQAAKHLAVEAPGLRLASAIQSQCYRLRLRGHLTGNDIIQPLQKLLQKLPARLKSNGQGQC